MMFVALSVMLAACEQPASRAATNASVPATVYADAVDDPARTAEDRQSDPGRKPAEVMQFFGIAPGMRVLDLFSGGGYYSELLSYVVGQTGSVVAQTNSAYLGFVGDQFRARFENDRLPNVTVLVAENNELELPAGGFDAVVMILAYHDIYYANPANGWEKIDGPKLLREIHHAMKPGAVLGIVDHYAESGAARETGGTVHRIDPGIVIGELEAAGFVLEAKSDLLRNMNDDYGKSVFDPAVRGTTDRFVLRFRKPE
jgi:predicted methyltransferase